MLVENEADGVKNEAEKIKKAALTQEGNALLSLVAKDKEKADASNIVGLDGKPVSVDTKPLMDKSAQKAAKRRQIEEMSKYIQERIKTDVVLRDMAGSILDLYCALFWMIQEVQCYEGMNADLANYLANHCREQAMTKGFRVEMLMDNMKKFTIPFMTRLSKTYIEYEKKRMARIGALKNTVGQTVLEKGISHPELPESVEKRTFPQGFQLGSCIILRGEPEAVKDAISEFISKHERTDKGRAVRFIDNDDKRPSTVARSTYEGTAKEYSEFETKLTFWGTDGWGDKDFTLLGVDDLSIFNADKRQALVCLATWCAGNLVCGVIGEPNGKEADSEQKMTIGGPFKRLLVVKTVGGVLEYSAFEENIKK